MKKKEEPEAKEIELKITPQREVDKCETCPLRKSLLEAIEKATNDARKAQEYYQEEVKRVNETLAKYTKKIDELDKSGK